MYPTAYHNDFKNCAELMRSIKTLSARISGLDISGRKFDEGTIFYIKNRQRSGDYKVQLTYLRHLLKERYPARYKNHIRGVEAMVRTRVIFASQKLNKLENDNLRRQQEKPNLETVHQGEGRPTKTSGQIQGGRA